MRTSFFVVIILIIAGVVASIYQILFLSLNLLGLPQKVSYYLERVFISTTILSCAYFLVLAGSKIRRGEGDFKIYIVTLILALVAIFFLYGFVKTF